MDINNDLCDYEFSLMEEEYVTEQMDNDVLKVTNTIDKLSIWFEDDKYQMMLNNYNDIIDEQIERLEIMRRK